MEGRKKLITGLLVTILILLAVFILINMNAQGKRIYMVQLFTGTGQKSSLTIEEGNFLTKPDDPTKEGYAFLGWFLGDELFDFNTPIMQNIKLEAKWQELEKDEESYIVKFDTSGGTSIQNQVISKGSKVIKPDDPTKEGCAFLGWFLEEKEYNFDTEVTENIELVARFEKIEVQETNPTNELNSNNTNNSSNNNTNTNNNSSNNIKNNNNSNANTNNSNSDTNTNTNINANTNTKNTNNNNSNNNSNASNNVNTNTNNSSNSNNNSNSTNNTSTINSNTNTTPNNNSNNNTQSKTKDYTITYNLNGGKQNNPKTKYKKTETFKLINPTKEGYAFLGWTGSNGNAPQRNVTIKKGTTGNLTYTANWVLAGDINGDGKITYNEDIQFLLFNSFFPEEYPLTTEGRIAADVDLDNKITDKDSSLIGLYIDGVINILPYTGTIPKYYVISYNNIEKITENTLKHNYIKATLPIKLINPTKEGFVFVGWTGSNGNTPQKEVTIQKGTTGNLNYTANWISYGDVNGDEKINNNDASAINQYLEGKITLTALGKKNADVDLDGYITYNDFDKLNKKLAGWNIELGNKNLQVTSALYGDYTLDNQINQSDIDGFTKFLNNSNREVAPYILKYMDLNGDGKVDTSDLKILNSLAGLNLISSEELSVFKSNNNINPDDRYAVEKTTTNVNGVNFNVYYVFDVKQYNTEFSQMKSFATNSLNRMGRINQKILQAVRTNGTNIIFFGDYNADNAIYSNKTGHYNYSGYCNSTNRNIIIGFDSGRFSDYYYNSIIHETGHAYDFLLYYTLTGDTGKGISGITQEELSHGFVNSKGQTISSERIKQMILENYSWKVVENTDVQAYVNNFDHVYSLEDYNVKFHEYYADVFKNYFVSQELRQKLQAKVPKTYQALEKSLNYYK